MADYPKSITELISQFSKLPGIGHKTAERLVFHLLSRSAADRQTFSQALADVGADSTACTTCFNIAEGNPCPICKNQQRSKGVICIVAKPQDLRAIERTGRYEGVYHVLGGTIDPLEGTTADQLAVTALIHRINENTVQEVILAFSPDMAGETTMLYLSKVLKAFPKLKITRLARGLPIGSDLEYADELTLENALMGRKDF